MNTGMISQSDRYGNKYSRHRKSREDTKTKKLRTYQCRKCGEIYEAESRVGKCPNCGHGLKIRVSGLNNSIPHPNSRLAGTAI